MGGVGGFAGSALNNILFRVFGRNHLNAARVGYLEPFHNGRRDSESLYINAVSDGIHVWRDQSLKTPWVNNTTTEQKELSACHFQVLSKAYLPLYYQADGPPPTD